MLRAGSRGTTRGRKASSAPRVVEREREQTVGRQHVAGVDTDLVPDPRLVATARRALRGIVDDRAEHAVADVRADTLVRHAVAGIAVGQRADLLVGVDHPGPVHLRRGRGGESLRDRADRTHRADRPVRATEHGLAVALEVDRLAAPRDPDRAARFVRVRQQVLENGIDLGPGERLRIVVLESGHLDVQIVHLIVAAELRCAEAANGGERHRMSGTRVGTGRRRERVDSKADRRMRVNDGTAISRCGHASRRGREPSTEP